MVSIIGHQWLLIICFDILGYITNLFFFKNKDSMVELMLATNTGRTKQDLDVTFQEETVESLMVSQN